MMIRTPVLASSLIFLALTGCIRIGPKPPAGLLSLRAQASAADGSGATGGLGDAIAVVEPEADARIAVLRVAVQVNGAQVAYLKGAQWVERPTRQFQHVLAETLRAQTGHLVVEGDPVRAGTRLSGRLLDLEYDARSHAAVVRFEAVKEHAGILETHRFAAKVADVSAKPAAVGSALNAAANTVARDVAAWVG